MRLRKFGLVAAAALLTAGSMPPAVPAAHAASFRCTNCSTVAKQILEWALLGEQLSEQIKILAEAKTQVKHMETNLLKNKDGVRVDDILRVTRDIARVMQMGKDIASTAQRASQSFDKDIKSPDGTLFSEKYRNLSDFGQAALKNSLLQAGLQRERFADDQSALDALVQSANNANGNLAALNALSSIGAHQIRESMQLRSLIAEHQGAMATYLATQAEKEQTQADNEEKVWTIQDRPLSPPRPKRPGNF